MEGPVDERLSGAYQQEEGEVEADEDSKRVALAGKLAARDGQRKTDAGLTVELPRELQTAAKGQQLLPLLTPRRRPTPSWRCWG